MAKVKQKSRNKAGFSLGWWLFTVFVSFVISIFIIFAVQIIWNPDVKAISEQINDKISFIAPTQKKDSLPKINDRVVVLAMGVDSNGRNTDPFEHTRTDTMILLSFDPKKKSINAVSIPRDSKVYLAGGKGIDKINAAHAYGGVDLAVATVEETFGVNVDHYILVDYNGLKELITALDGIDVFVEKKMRYKDHSAKLYIDLEPGKQRLDADKAEQYLRFRHDPEGDIGRIKRQQWFLKGVLEKMKDPAIVFRIPQLIQFAQKNVRTDMDMLTMLKLAGFSKDIDFNNVQIGMVPGTPSQRSAISYWLVDAPKTQKVIEKLILGYGSQETDVEEGNPITLSVMYNKEKEEEVAPLLESLEQYNYKVVCRSRTKENHTKIVSHTERATLDKTNALRNDVAQIRTAPMFVSPGLYQCASSDYTIVLGNDT